MLLIICHHPPRYITARVFGSQHGLEYLHKNSVRVGVDQRADLTTVSDYSIIKRCSPDFGTPELHVHVDALFIEPETQSVFQKPQKPERNNYSLDHQEGLHRHYKP